MAKQAIEEVEMGLRCMYHAMCVVYAAVHFESHNNNNRNNITANTIEHQSNLFAIADCHKNQ